jgi:hypothetical protein
MSRITRMVKSKTLNFAPPTNLPVKLALIRVIREIRVQRF